MEGALIILAVTVAVGLLLYWQDRRQRRKHPETNDDGSVAPKSEEGHGAGGVCCGLHLVCEKGLPKMPGEPAEYFEDEELDRFQGRGADDYDEAETEEFRDVLLTLRRDEVVLWAQSLEQRGLVPPAIVKEELMMMLSEGEGGVG